MTEALFAQTPANGIGYVALAAPVWAHNGGYAGTKGEFGLLGKGLESFEVYSLNSQHIDIGWARSVRSEPAVFPGPMLMCMTEQTFYRTGKHAGGRHQQNAVKIGNHENAAGSKFVLMFQRRLGPETSNSRR